MRVSLTVEAYQVRNLEELQQVITQAIETASAAAGRRVHPSEILTETDVLNVVPLQLNEEMLTDKSMVYSVEFPGQQAQG